MATPGKRLTKEQKAIEAYLDGEKDLEKAAGYLVELAAADSDKSRKKFRKKADSRYKKAIKDFKKSIKKKDDLFQVHAQMGFALRSLGRYEEALASYDTAIAIEPRYGDAIEYRAEAYLELGRLEECKEAYMQLYPAVPELAQQLMDKMQDWIGEQPAGPDGEPAPELTDFTKWVQERDGIAHQTTARTSSMERIW